MRKRCLRIKKIAKLNEPILLWNVIKSKIRSLLIKFSLLPIINFIISVACIAPIAPTTEPIVPILSQLSSSNY